MKLVTILFSLLLASCTTINYISMDMLAPSELSFPPSIKSVAIVDNAVNHDTLRTEHISIGVLEGNGKTMALQLANLVADADFFEEVILCDSSLRTGVHSEKPVLLTPHESNALINDLQVDMLVTVDAVCVNTTPVTPVMWGGVPSFLQLRGLVTSAISIYMPTRKEPMNAALVAHDTLYWNLHSEALTERRVVEEASAHAAAMSLKYLVPQWQTEERFYYTGTTVNMRDAAIYLREHNWEEAFRLWKQTYDGAKARSKRRMQMALNLAVYHEVTGNVEQALAYAKEALRIAKPSSGEYRAIDYYCNHILPDKVMAIQKLNLQLGRFGEEKR